MSTVTDSVKIRALAQRISRAASAVAGVKTDSLQRIPGEMPANFRGDAADALTDEVEKLMADVSSVSAGLTALSRELYNLAYRVEQADREAEQAIRTK